MPPIHFHLILLLCNISIAFSHFNKLNAIIHDIIIPLPNIHQDITIFGTKSSITLYDLTCTNTSLQNLQLDTKDNTDHIQTSFNLTGVALACHSNFNLSLAGNPGQGQVLLDLDGTSLTFTEEINKSNNNDQLPDNAKLLECDMEVVISKIFFYGGVVADLLNDKTIIDLIITQITSLVNGKDGVVCNGLQNITQTKITPLLASVSNVLRPYVPSTAPINASTQRWQVAEEKLLKEYNTTTTTNRFANWSESPIISFLHWFIRLELWLPAPCWLPGTTVGTHGINNLFRGLAQDNGAINVTLTPPLSVINADSNTIFDIDINITSVALIGLDTFSNFDILRPVSNLTLESNVAIEHLDIKIGLDVNYYLPGTTPKTIHVIVDAFQFQQLELNISTLIVVDEEYLNALPLGAAVQHILGCMSHSVLETDVTDVELRVGSVHSPSIHGALSKMWMMFCLQYLQ